MLQTVNPMLAKIGVTPKNAGGNVTGGRNQPLVTDEELTPTLESMGISYDLSSRAQQMASIPDDEFEATLAEHREEQKAVTGRTMERLVKGAHQHITSSESVEAKALEKLRKC
jgi:hypothetical protein